MPMNTEITRPDALCAVGESPYPGHCERWDRCAVNQCPLDHLRARLRAAVPGDPQATCGAPLKDRLAVAEIATKDGAKLPWGGMSRKEADSGRTVVDLIAEDDAQAALRKAKGEHMREVAQERKNSPGGEAVGAPMEQET
jgi:hypothetical protein